MAGSRLGNFLARAFTPIIMLAAVLVAFSRCSGESYTASAPAACPPIPAGAIWLPADRISALEDLEAKARRLNDSGVCVLDGSFGTDSAMFYLTVQPLGSTRPEIRRFDRAQLTR